VTVKIYINKILKDKGLKPLPKKTNLIGNNCMTIAFESLKEKVSGLKKNKVLSKDESEILCLALHNAKAYGPLLDMYDDIDGRIIAAQKILRGGRNKKNMGEALDIIMDREKGSRHAEIDWHMLADDYMFLTKLREPLVTPIEAINEIIKRYNEKRLSGLRKDKIANLEQKISQPKNNSEELKHLKKQLKQLRALPMREAAIPASSQALLKGLKRFKKKTNDPVLMEALETLPWSDDLEICPATPSPY
jgi:hypothetical protein